MSIIIAAASSWLVELMESSDGPSESLHVVIPFVTTLSVGSRARVIV